MTSLDRLTPRTTMTSRNRVRRASHRQARDARLGRSLEGVVASYIRELAAAGDGAPGRSTVQDS